MPSDWDETSVSDLSVEGGAYGSGASALPYDPNLPRYVRITDIRSDGRLNEKTHASIRRQDADGHELKLGDLLFARSGATVGKTYLYRCEDGPCAHAGYVIRFSINPVIADSHYVFHWTQSSWFSQWVQGTLRQGAQPNINATEYGRHKVSLPPLPEQRLIAEILDTVDLAIRKTEAIIAKLGQVKQGLLHDLLTRGIDDNGELRDPDRHPEQFKDSPLGRIPKAWEATLVGSVVRQIEQGWSPDCESYPASAGQWGVLRTTSVVWAGYQGAENKALPLALKPRPEYEVKPNDVLMTRAGPNSRVGVVAFVTATRSRLILSDKLYRLLPSHDVLPNFLVRALSGHHCQSHLSTLKTGLAESQTNISKAIVRKLLIPVPPLQEQWKIGDVLESQNARFEREHTCLDKLRLLKQGLMDDLLTGRVRVTSLLQEAAT